MTKFVILSKLHKYASNTEENYSTITNSGQNSGKNIDVKFKTILLFGQFHYPHNHRHFIDSIQQISPRYC